MCRKEEILEGCAEGSSEQRPITWEEETLPGNRGFLTGEVTLSFHGYRVFSS